MNTVTLSHGRGWLDAPAAASIHRIDAEIGHVFDITEAGRERARQQYHWDRYLDYLNGGPWAPIALPPGSSTHEFGRAIDTDEQITAVLNRHGWFHTVYRNGVLVEPWHYEYDYTRDQHINEGNPMAQQDDSNTWTGQRIGGSLSGPSVTDLLRELNSKVDALALDQAFTKQQLGGSGARDTSLRQDVDKIKRKLGV